MPKKIIVTKIKESDNYIKPILKWVGGKTQIIDNVISEFPNEINNYHELFIGGGSVLFALLQSINENKIKLTGKIYAYDINETLINLYKNVQSKSDEIIKEITPIINTYSSLEGKEIIRNPDSLEEAITSKESYYYWLRKQYNNLSRENKNKPIGTAYFIFLNKTCFRGVYRESPKSGFNVPYGHYKNPEILNNEHLEIISKLIKDVNFIHSSFEDSFKRINKDDFIYLDPPYAPENDTSFVGYTSDGFDLEKHELLFKLCKKYKFVMSNSDVELVRESFKQKKYKIKTILCKRSINSKKPDSKTNEVIIKSF